MQRLLLAALFTACQGNSGASDPPRPPPSQPRPAEAPAARAPAPAPTPPASALAVSGDAQSVTSLRASVLPVGSEHRLTGFVVKRYQCPPCPQGAQCKPCMGANIVVSDDATLHDQYDLDDRDVIVFTDDPMNFDSGAKVTLRVRVLDRRQSNRGINDLELVP